MISTVGNWTVIYQSLALLNLSAAEFDSSLLLTKISFLNSRMTFSPAFPLTFLVNFVDLSSSTQPVNVEVHQDSVVFFFRTPFLNHFLCLYSLSLSLGFLLQFCGFNYYRIIPKYMLSLNPSPLLQTHVSNSLLNISTQMSMRYLRLNVPTNQFLIVVTGIRIVLVNHPTLVSMPVCNVSINFFTHIPTLSPNLGWPCILLLSVESDGVEISEPRT